MNTWCSSAPARRAVFGEMTGGIRLRFTEATVDKLPSPRAKFADNPHLSGRDGGRTINLHLFARAGVKLLGHLIGAEDGKILLAPDLKGSLARSDKAEADITAMI